MNTLEHVSGQTLLYEWVAKPLKMVTHIELEKCLISIVNCTNVVIASKEDGKFSCPQDRVKKVDAQGQTVVHPKYPHEEDCQKFYVCLNGHDKRSLGCEAGKVYNTDNEQCDDPENVAGW